MCKKEDLVKELISIGKMFESETGESMHEITRSYYRTKTSFGSSFEKEFADFTSFKKEAFDLDDNKLKTLDYEKKIIIMQDEISRLTAEKKQLLKESVSDSELVRLFTEQKLPNISVKKLSLSDIKKTPDIKEGVLVLSDWHLGEVVIPEEVNGANAFNKDIMFSRLDRVFKYFVYYCQKYDIKKIQLLFLGDLISGEIHQELMRTNEMNVVDCVFTLQEYIVKKVLEIESYFNSIECEFVVGNHDRLPEKPEYKTAAKLSWGYVLARQTHEIFNAIQKDIKEKDRKIKINVSDSVFTIKTIAGRRFLLTHGNMLMGGGSGGFSGIPYYALAQSSAKVFGVIKQIGVEKEDFQDIIMGHLHTTSKVGLFTGGNLYVNGCIIGTNEYSLFKMRSIAKVEQTMLVIEDGNVNAEIVLRGDE